jgi:hypothetical protein
MDFPVKFLNASNGAPATDMTQTLVTEWSRCGNKDRPSYQNAWPAGATGTFSLQFTNAESPGFDATATDYPAAAMSVPPTQPTGTENNNILCVDSIAEYVRERYVPTSGGAGILPTARLAQTQNDET